MSPGQQNGGSRDESILWQDLTNVELEQARDENALVLVPLGAMEQHGPHLPVDTDIAIAWAVAREVAKRLGNTVVAPPIWWGYSSSHMGFAGTLSLRPDTMLALLDDICGSLVSHGFGKIAIVSSHATNRPVGQLFVREFAARRGVTILYIHYVDFARKVFAELRQTKIGGEMHAGEFETALQLYLHPELVRFERAVSDYVEPKKHFGISTAAADLTDAGNVALGYDIKQIFPTGVMGDPAPATAELGERIFETVAAGITAALDEYRAFDYGDARATALLDPESWRLA